MKKLFLISVLFLVVTACGTASPQPTPTATPSPTSTPLPPTETPIPTPTVETGPNGTVVQKDYLNNKYSVDAQGMPTYWFNTETNQWEKFTPIDFDNPQGWQIVEQEIVYTSGWYEQEIIRAMKENEWQPKSQNPYYIKADEWFPLQFDLFGSKSLYLNPDVIITKPSEYNFQPTDFYTVFNDGNKQFLIITNVLLYQTKDGQQVRQPISYKLPIEEVNREGSDTLILGLEQRSGYFPMTLIPIVDFDPSKIDQANLDLLTQLNPIGAATINNFIRYHTEDKYIGGNVNGTVNPEFLAQQAILLRLYNGDETALQEIGKHLFSPDFGSISDKPTP